MPINPKTLASFREGTTDRLDLTSHRPSLEPSDMQAIVASIRVRLQNGHKAPITLFMDDNEIGDEGIEQLNISTNPEVTDASAELVAGWEIDALSIRGTQITDKGVKKLLLSSHLKSFHVADRQVSKDVMGQVQAFNEKIRGKETYQPKLVKEVAEQKNIDLPGQSWSHG